MNIKKKCKRIILIASVAAMAAVPQFAFANCSAAAGNGTWNAETAVKTSVTKPVQCFIRGNAGSFCGSNWYGSYGKWYPNGYRFCGYWNWGGSCGQDNQDGTGNTDTNGGSPSHNLGTNDCVNGGTNCGTDNNVNDGTDNTDNNVNGGTGSTDSNVNGGTDNNANGGTDNTDNNVNGGTNNSTGGSTNGGETNSGSHDSSVSSYASQVADIVNQERAAKGLSSLSYDSSLARLAQLKAEDMAKNNYFSHQSPTYGSAFDMMKTYGVSYRSAGENIARGQKTPSAVMDSWMNSSGHKANILSTSYSSIGVGYAVDANGRACWVQMFKG